MAKKEFRSNREAKKEKKPAKSKMDKTAYQRERDEALTQPKRKKHRR